MSTPLSTTTIGSSPAQTWCVTLPLPLLPLPAAATSAPTACRCNAASAAPANSAAFADSAAVLVTLLLLLPAALLLHRAAPADSPTLAEHAAHAAPALGAQVKLGLSHLVGTNLLRAYMHGFFVDNRLYNKAKVGEHASARSPRAASSAAMRPWCLGAMVPWCRTAACLAQPWACHYCAPLDRRHHAPCTPPLAPPPPPRTAYPRTYFWALWQPPTHPLALPAARSLPMQAIAEPFAYEAYRAKRIEQKLEEERKSRISLVKKLPKVGGAALGPGLASPGLAWALLWCGGGGYCPC